MCSESLSTQTELGLSCLPVVTHLGPWWFLRDFMSPVPGSSPFLDIQSCTIWLLQKPRNLTCLSSQPSNITAHPPAPFCRIEMSPGKKLGPPWHNHQVHRVYFPSLHNHSSLLIASNLKCFLSRILPISWRFLWKDPIWYHLLCHD